MQINTNALPCCDAVICGEVLKPDADDSCYAVFTLDSCACGVTVETGTYQPWLRFTPAIQIPPCARKGFERFQFEHPDDAMVDLSLDATDGELTMRRDLPDLDPASIEPVLREALTWIDTVAYPAIVAYLRTACKG